MIINFVLITFVHCALNVYTNDESEQLLNNTNYTVAPFGTIPYGKSVSGAIYLPPIKESNQKLDQLHFCNSSNINQYDSYFSYIPSKWIVIRAGVCSATLQAINAQSIGAQLVILVSEDDNKDLNILRDDGYGYKVKIPVILISQNNGDTLYRKLIDQFPGGMIRGYIKFDEFGVKNESKVLFGLSIENRETFRLIHNFKQYYDLLKSFVQFDIFYDFLECYKCREEGFVNEHQDCIMNGRYCQIDPDGDLKGNGAHVVQEQYRQLCLWKYNRTHWWNYMEYFRSQCTKAVQYEQCFKLFITDQLYDEVMKCDNQEGISKILDGQLQLKANAGLTYFPGLTINGRVYRGSIEVMDIKNAICSSLKGSNQLLGCQDEEFIIAKNNRKSYSWLILIVLVTTLLFIWFLLFVFRQMMKNQMKAEVKRNVEDAINRYKLYYGD